MYIIAFALPLIALLAAFLCGVDVAYWLAYALITVAAEGLVYLVFWFKTRSKEYLSGYITGVIHHYAWTERKEITETKYEDGKSYTVKRVEYVDHPEEFYYSLNTGKTRGTDSDLFYELSNHWGTGRYPISVCHPNCVGGGDGEACDWDGREYNTYTETYTHRYRNPVKNSNSIFRGRRISREEAGKLGLFEYPDAGMDQHVLLISKGMSYRKDFDKTEFELQHLNAFCGSLHEIHVFLLLFPAEAGVDIALKQRDYWEGCNKNEFVVCLGMDGKEVAWCHTLSWMDEPMLDVAVKDWFVHHKEPQLSAFVRWLRDNLHLWKRKEFMDFKYLGWHMSQMGSIWFWLTSLATSLVVLLCSFWIGGWPADIHRRHVAEVEAQRLYQTEQRLAAEMRRRAPGVYYFAFNTDLFKVEIKDGGTLSVQKLPSYSYRGNNGMRYRNDDKCFSGEWSVNDPLADIDILLHSDAFGYNDLRFSGGMVYTTGYNPDGKPVSSYITGAEYEWLLDAAKSGSSDTRWVQDTTFSRVYEDGWGFPYKRNYSVQNGIWLHADGSFEAWGPIYYDPDDMETFEVQGDWKCVNLQMQSDETYDFHDNSNWGLLLRISSGGRPPKWISSLEYVHNRPDYNNCEYLIVGDTGYFLMRGWVQKSMEEEIIEAERNMPFDAIIGDSEEDVTAPGTNDR